jgi:CheY-like chemotaxis protein
MPVMSKRVLLVEENKVCRKFLSQLLSSIGYAVIEANTGLDGIIKATSELPDLIMMGADLPQLSGIEATAWLKKHSYTKNIPVLIYSPSSSLIDEKDAVKAGAVAIVNDPVSIDALRKTLRGCVTRVRGTMRKADYDSIAVRP